jgi:hypothetical protein
MLWRSQKPGVMPGLDPGIHLSLLKLDCRVKSGNDGGEIVQESRTTSIVTLTFITG